MNLPNRDYPHLVVLRPKANVSHTPKVAPEMLVFTGMVCAILIEVAIVAAVLFTRWAWRLL